jgi:hypothetical protein
MEAAFVATIERHSDGSIRLHWPASEGQTDRVEFSPHLQGPWETRANPASGGTFEETPQGTGGFYRIVRE